MTPNQILEYLDSVRTFSNSVLIRPNLPYNLLELDKDFFEELKKEIKQQIMLSKALDMPINPSVRFILEILKDAS